jgi:hypothetical protein
MRQDLLHTYTVEATIVHLGILHFLVQLASCLFAKLGSFDES